MMSTTPTPETLSRHELVGLNVEVVSASNPDLVGLAGEVVTETTQTLGVERAERHSVENRTESGGTGRVSQVPKADAVFAFALPECTPTSGETTRDATGDEQTVTVDGERLVARPARRTERRSDSKWR